MTDVVTTRKVLVFSTTGQNGKEVTTDSKTWEQLKRALSSNSVTHSGMKAVVGESKVTLESPNAELPTGNFTLFLMPKKTKSGTDYKNLPYKQCRAMIKVFIDTADDVDKAKKFFSVDGKNYTQTTTDDMRKNIAKWVKKNPISQGGKLPSPKKEKADFKVDVPDKAKNIDIFEFNVEMLTPKELKQYAKLQDKVSVIVDKALERFAKEQEKKKEEEAKAKAEAEEKRKEEKERKAKEEEKAKRDKDLSTEAEDLMRDFDDVSY